MQTRYIIWLKHISVLGIINTILGVFTWFFFIKGAKHSIKSASANSDTIVGGLIMGIGNIIGVILIVIAVFAIFNLGYLIYLQRSYRNYQKREQIEEAKGTLYAIYSIIAIPVLFQINYLLGAVFDGIGNRNNEKKEQQELAENKILREKFILKAETQTFVAKEDMGFPPIAFFTADAKGTAWITNENGVFFYENNTWKNVSGKAKDFFQIGYEPVHNKVWVVRKKGIAFYENGAWKLLNPETRYNSIFDLPTDKKSLFFDQKGNVYYRAFDDIILKWNNVKWSKLEAGITIDDAAEFTALDENVYRHNKASTGIGVFEKGSWRVYSTDDNFANYDCSTLDRHRNIWLLADGANNNKYLIRWSPLSEKNDTIAMDKPVNQGVNIKDVIVWDDYIFREDATGNKYFGLKLSDKYLIAKQNLAGEWKFVEIANDAIGTANKMFVASNGKIYVLFNRSQIIQVKL